MTKHDLKLEQADDTIAMLRAALKRAQETIEELRQPDKRIVDFFWNNGIGAGDDPVKTLLASYILVEHERYMNRQRIEELEEEVKFLTEENNDLMEAYDRMARNVP